MSTDDDGERSGDGARRTPEQERRAAERARRIREKRSADRARGTGSTAGSTARGTGGTAARGRGGTAARGTSDTAARGRTGGAAARGKGGTAVRDRAARAQDPPDPRFRRRRMIALAATLVVVLLGLSAAAWWALGRYGPGVDEVAVTGTRQIPARDVSDAAAVEPGTPLAAVDTDGVTARVSAIPGVATVDVSRSWPHTLSVEVTERTPAGVVDSPSGPQLVDVGGLVYRPAPAGVRLPKLLLPSVAPGDPATLAAASALQALPQQIRDQVQTLALGPGGTTFELGLTDDRTVLWGPWADGDLNARRAAALGPLLSREGAVYDVSSPDLVTVRGR